MLLLYFGEGDSRHIIPGFLCSLLEEKSAFERLCHGFLVPCPRVLDLRIYDFVSRSVRWSFVLQD